jgi:hypothetical protein
VKEEVKELIGCFNKWLINGLRESSWEKGRKARESERARERERERETG